MLKSKWIISMGKKFVSLFLVLVFVITMLPAETSWAAGDESDTVGTVEISTADELSAIRDNLFDNYRLVSDIDLSGIAWVPIGTNTAPFCGSLDGNGYTVKNLSISLSTQDYVGLFGYNKGFITNLKLSGIEISGKSYTGSLAGCNTGRITDCPVSKIVKITGSTNYTGGLIGYNSGTVINSPVTGITALNGKDYTGGLIGYSNGGSITNSSVTELTNLKGGNYTDGLIGYNDGSIKECKVIGVSLEGTSYTGGFVGYHNNGTIQQSYTAINVKGTGETGGFLGYTRGGTIERCYATGNVIANSYSGGFVGNTYNYYGLTIRNCFATGNTDQGSYSGGFAGNIASNVKVENCYTTSGNLNGFSYNGTITNCYFNKDNSDSTKAEGRNTAEMQQKDTYIGWDFNTIWEMEDGYPTLRRMEKADALLIPDILQVLSPAKTVVKPYLLQMTLTVPHEIEMVTVDLTVYNFSEWKLYKDSVCTKEIESREIELSVGDNRAYVKIESTLGTSKTYTLTVTRQTPRPQIVTGFRAMSGTYEIHLAWDIAYQASVQKYKIYRSLCPDSGFAEIAQVNGRTVLSYIDKAVSTDVEYYYKISAVDNLSVESFMSVGVLGIAMVDKTPPVVLGITPTHGTMIGRKTSITVRCEDNKALSSVSLEYLDGETWKTVETRTVSGQSASVVFSLSSLTINGNIKIRAIATDLAGNKSDGETTRTYGLKSSGPEKMTGLTATPYENSILLRWNDVADDTFSYFIVEQKDSQNGAYRRIATVKTTLGYEVTGLVPNKSYWFRVAACDVFDNQGDYTEIEAQTNPDATKPVVTSIKPLPGYFASVIPVSLTITDNGGVNEIWIETSTDMVNWKTALTVTINPATNISVTKDVPIANIPEGSCFVRAFAKDTAGNISNSSSVVEHRVDRTAPAKPTGLSAAEAVTTITIQWEKGLESDLKNYNIYRATADSGPYTLLAGNLSSVGYIDRSVLRDTTYYYKVTATDAAGNVSAYSNIISAKPIEDTIAPTIHSVSPTNNTMVGKDTQIRVLAQDNGVLASISAEVQIGGEWVSIGTVSASGDSFIGNFVWQNRTLAGGMYNLRFTATDIAGNTSETCTITYNLQNFELSKPIVTATPGDYSITVTWTEITANNLSGYKLFRRDETGNKQLIAIQPKYTMKYIDQNLDPNKTYSYYVEAADGYGNISASETVTATPLDNDTVVPVAKAGYDTNTYIGIETAFDGSMSTDNIGIVSYHWDFGDGNTSSEVKPVHVYESAGEYNAALTVADATGNSTKSAITVRAMQQAQGGDLEVKIIDKDSGLPLPYASVYADTPGGPLLSKANANGIVTIRGESGTYIVSAYTKDYLPKEQSFEVEKGITKTATIALESGELIVGKVLTRRLPLAEIEARGIDTTAPENTYVYNFEVTLVFQEKELPTIQYTLNGLGEILKTKSEYGTGIPLQSGGKEVAKAVPQVIPVPDHPEIAPTIAFLKTSASASFLKEFFEVSVVMKNMADPQFVLTDSVATLNLPNGLALAPMYEQQSLEAKIGSIYGGQEVSHSWIVRGDEQGDYDLTVDYTGTLMPFKEPVAATFKTETPLTVNGARGLEIYLYPYDVAIPEELYLVPFALKNESDVTFNMVSMRFNGHSLTKDAPRDITKAEGGTDYVFDTVAGLDNLPFLYDGDSVTVRELFPGESLSGIYATVFDIDADPDKVYYELRDMFTQTLDGSAVNIPVTIIPTIVDKPVLPDPELFDFLKKKITDEAKALLPYAYEYWSLNPDTIEWEDREMLLLGLACGVNENKYFGLGYLLTDISLSSDYEDDPTFLQGKIFADAYFALSYSYLEPFSSIIDVFRLDRLTGPGLTEAYNNIKGLAKGTRALSGATPKTAAADAGTLVNPEALAGAAAAGAVAVALELGLTVFAGLEIVAIGQAALCIRSMQLVCADYEKYDEAVAAREADSSTKTRILADVRAEISPNALYQIAYISSSGSLIRMYNKLTFAEAVVALGGTGSVNKVTNDLNQRYRFSEVNPLSSDVTMVRSYGYWGIYTHDQADAKALATVFGCTGKPEVHGSGMYGHYHDSGHNFHIWYGGMLNY